MCAGEPGFLRGLELQRELERLCYRERRTFCVQATVTMVMYRLRGQVRAAQQIISGDICCFLNILPSEEIDKTTASCSIFKVKASVI